jgi:predicted Zn-dependent peptidase
VEQIGGNLNAYTSRETTCYMMTVFNKHSEQAVDIIGDMLTSSLYRAADVDNERSTIYRELIETQKSGPMETIIEMAHRGAYKNHQMGLPILGSIGNMKTISRDMIVDFHDRNYVGSNIIVVGCGPI